MLDNNNSQPYVDFLNQENINILSQNQTQQFFNLMNLILTQVEVEWR